jgi:hypothetical protein
MGGARPGAGRKPGHKTDETLEKERTLTEVRKRIRKNAQRILEAQMSLALGQQFLYRIDTVGEKGQKSKPILVTSEAEIAAYIDGEYGNGFDGDATPDGRSYYYMTTKEPENLAIDSMLNRALGKPTEHVEVTNTGAESFRDLSDEQLNDELERTAAELADAKARETPSPSIN